MHTRLLLNQKGMSLMIVLFVMGIIGLSAISIMSMGDQKRKMSDQINISLSANLVKQKLLGLVMSPLSWQTIQIRNSTAFTAFNPAQPPTLDIFTPGSNLPYYQPSLPHSGFDLKGQTCANFNATEGNDQCPLRYEIKLKNRVFQNGNWIDTLSFVLLFKPASNGFILNTTQAQYTFDLVRNLNDQSVESACVSISGVYDAATNSCSQKITKSVASCAPNQTYRGPASNSSSTNCDPKTMTPKTCPGGQVIKGFLVDGQPYCGAPL